MSLCAFCDSFMEWPRQCVRCLDWFCSTCVGASHHDCPMLDYEPEDRDEDPA